jgi:hypothetical protein
MEEGMDPKHQSILKLLEAMGKIRRRLPSINVSKYSAHQGAKEKARRLRQSGKIKSS